MFNLIPLGLNLNPNDKKVFDQIKEQADKCVNDILGRPDWGANMTFIDLVNGSSQAVTNETVALMKRKISTSNATVVLLALHLIEAMVKNCGDRMHRAINDESFLKELGKVPKRFIEKTDSTCAEVAELSLDIIQTWGEAFLPRSRQYPNISKLYHELKRDGLPFKAQYDESKVPIFTPAPYIPEDNRDEDAALQAALAASLNSQYQIETTSVLESDSRPRHNPGSRSNDNRATAAHQSSASSNNILQTCFSLVDLLKDIVINSSTAEELRTNELSADISQQLKSYQTNLMVSIEEAVMKEASNLEQLFKANEDVTLLLQTYANVKCGGITIDDAKAKIFDIGTSVNVVGNGSHIAPKPTVIEDNEDIFGIFNKPSSTKATQNTKHPVQHHNQPQQNTNPSLKKNYEVDIFGDPVKNTTESDKNDYIQPQKESTRKPSITLIHEEALGLHSMMASVPDSTNRKSSQPPPITVSSNESTKLNASLLPPAYQTTGDCFGTAGLLAPTTTHASTAPVTSQPQLDFFATAPNQTLSTDTDFFAQTSVPPPVDFFGQNSNAEPSSLNPFDSVLSGQQVSQQSATSFVTLPQNFASFPSQANTLPPQPVYQYPPQSQFTDFGQFPQPVPDAVAQIQQPQYQVSSPNQQHFADFANFGTFPLQGPPSQSYPANQTSINYNNTSSNNPF